LAEKLLYPPDRHIQDTVKPGNERFMRPNMLRASTSVIDSRNWIIATNADLWPFSAG